MWRLSRLGELWVNTSIKIAGDNFDDATCRYVRKKHNLLIGSVQQKILRSRSDQHIRW